MKALRTRWLELKDRPGHWFGVYSVDVPEDGPEDPAEMELTMFGPLAIFADRLDAASWEPVSDLFPSGSHWHAVSDEAGNTLALFPSAAWAREWAEGRDGDVGNEPAPR